MSVPGPDPAAWVRERLRSDGHVHSTFSDGASDPATNLRAATAAGLTGIVMADHVRASTDWLPDFVAAIDAVRAGASMAVRIGVETKMLDTAGSLDLPARLDGVEVVLIADHQVPTLRGPVDPATMREALSSGRVEAAVVVRDLLDSMKAAVTRVDRPAVLVHPFSILPKIGLTEADIPDGSLRSLAERCRETGTGVEVNEKWACPGAAAARVVLAAGVDLVVGSDAHASEAIGRYRYVSDLLGELVPEGRHA